MKVIESLQSQQLPQNIEAEQRVLGAMLNDNKYVVETAEILAKEDFYKEAHKVIFENIIELYKKDISIDMITLVEKLRSKSQLENVGGTAYILELNMGFLRGINFKSYLDMILDKTSSRMAINAFKHALDDSYSGEKNIGEILEGTEQQLFKISQRKNKNENAVEQIDNVLTRGLFLIQDLYNNKGNLPGVSSGFTDLDAKTSGFQKGNMILIAARPSMGKTTFALNICENAAIKASKKVMFFSLEMSKDELILKMISSQSGVDLNKIRTGNLDDSDWEKISRCLGPLSSAKIFIDDTAAISVMGVKSKCRKLKMEVGLDLVVIDYLQLMSGEKAENRQQEVSQTSRAIKALAKEIGCPVIALSQLSRAPEQRADHRPIMSDLRESGSLEQDCDVIMMLYRDEYYNKDTEEKNIAECIIAKHRNGEVGTVELAWDGKHNRFGNLYKN